MIKQIPNLFTLLNLVLGCMACVMVLQPGIVLRSGDEGQLYYELPEKIVFASFFIAAGAVVDFLDGFLARLLRAHSAMGGQLDSLSDVVTFGVAPSLILYQFLRLAWASDPGGLDQSEALLWPAFVLPAAAAWRLARFNLQSAAAPLTYFQGLPVPAAGLFVASLPLLYWTINEAWVSAVVLSPVFLYGVIVLLSALMVSTLPLLAFKFNDFSWASNKLRYLVILLFVLLAVIFHWLALPLGIVGYVLLSLLFKKQFA